jgi:hypothetical protein
MTGQGYSFKPMMPFYIRFMQAPTAFLESKEARQLLAKVLRLCRQKYGRTEARSFSDALLWLGVYPGSNFL